VSDLLQLGTHHGLCFDIFLPEFPDAISTD
jgi:hypothetical protein